jgi:toxin CptA
MKADQAKHQATLPTPRSIRRACGKELYRTLKRLKQHVPEEKMQEAVDRYYRRVIENLEWIAQNHDNRRRLADWWDESVSGEIAELWSVDRDRLCRAFRDAFGG